MSNNRNHARTGAAAARTAKPRQTGGKALAAAGADNVAKQGAQARQSLAVQCRDGEWMLQISLSLSPASGFGGPGDGPKQIDPPTANLALAAGGAAGKGKAPGDGPKQIDPPGAQNLAAATVVHAPIELRGANITVRFATHAAKLVGKNRKGPGDGPGTIDPPADNENEN